MSLRVLIRIALLAALALLIAPTGAQAAGTPNISLAKSAPDVLYGEDGTVTLTASNPTGQPTGYNLSFNDVLPPGISYVAGSAPGSVGEPQIINNAPTSGSTTLIWSNVADLTANSTFSFDFKVKHSTSTYEVGDTYTDNAGAYINCDARYVPDFGANGQATQTGGNATCSGTPAEESYTGSATASAATTIKAIKLEKAVADAPEGELLRGLHDHQTVYTLTATNNGINPTNGLDIEDYVPAGLEFLACGTVDNTTDAPTNPGSAQEYPGSGPINPGNAPAAPNCVAPTTVETVQNPPGLPAGVYTHVVWTDVTNLNPGQVFELQYVAAIPLRANTMDWNGATPGNGTAPGTGGTQAANLDNNSGPETYEDGGSEPAFTNNAEASGNYQDGSPGGLPVSDDATTTVTSEDLRVLKSVDNDALQPGMISHWSLQIDTGEYRFVDDIVVTDTLGDAYCPLGSANLETTPPPADSECDPVGGESPSPDYTSATENADGTWTLIWDNTANPNLARLEPSSTYTITFPTRTRENYQENFTDSSPVLARDTAGNDVDIEGNDFIICAPGSPSPCPIGDPNKIDADEADGTTDTDSSSASQTGDGPTIDKSVSTNVNEAPCPTGSGSYTETGPTVRPGQTLCYRLRMNFPADISTGGVQINDFIPPGTTYVAGSTVATPNNNVTIVTGTPPQPDVNGSNLTWKLDDGADAVGKAQTFEVVFRVRVGRRAAAIDGDLLDNLMKSSYVNSDGVSFPLRDSTPFEIAQPEIGLVKGVRDVNNGPVQPPNSNYDGVVGGDVVTYQVDVSNTGSVDAENAQIWDLLPAEFTCAMVANISTPGSSSATCNAGQNRIEWTGVDVAANSTTTLTYDVTIPDGYSSGDVFVNNAGVRQYEHDTNGNGPFINIPAENIDPTQDPNANARPADDPAQVTVLAVPMTKTRTTQINEPGNNLASQATIGERIDYTVTTTIPAGTTLYGSARITDPLGSQQFLVPGSASATLDTDGPGGAAPVPLPTAGLTLSENLLTNLVRIDFPATYANAQGSGDDIIVLTMSAIVVDDVNANSARGNASQSNINNLATLVYENAAGATRTQNASVNTALVEPDVGITKTSNAGATVAPDDVLDYTLTATNSNAAGTSRANGTTIVDTVPDGLTPVNGANNPVADGGTVNPDGGTWNETARTITWTVGALDPGANAVVHYSVQVDEDAIGSGTLTNDAQVNTRSLAGGVNDSGRRTASSPGLNSGNDYGGYRADDDVTVRLLGASIGKSTTPASGTIGEQLTHTLTVTIPANIQLFDATVVDDIPDGLDFEGYVSAFCTSAAARRARPTSPRRPWARSPTATAPGSAGASATSPPPRLARGHARLHDPHRRLLQRRRQRRPRRRSAHQPRDARLQHRRRRPAADFPAGSVDVRSDADRRHDDRRRRAAPDARQGRLRRSRRRRRPQRRPRLQLHLHAADHQRRQLARLRHPRHRPARRRADQRAARPGRLLHHRQLDERRPRHGVDGPRPDPARRLRRSHLHGGPDPERAAHERPAGGQHRRRAELPGRRSGRSGSGRRVPQLRRRRSRHRHRDGADARPGRRQDDGRERLPRHGAGQRRIPLHVALRDHQPERRLDPAEHRCHRRPAKELVLRRGLRAGDRHRDADAGRSGEPDDHHQRQRRLARLEQPRLDRERADDRRHLRRRAELQRRDRSGPGRGARQRRDGLR
ncbi:MAG: isopeptide-forming domain-containing fimbrial protein [Solirubrobacterales bacterium]